MKTKFLIIISAVIILGIPESFAEESFDGNSSIDPPLSEVIAGKDTIMNIRFLYTSGPYALNNFIPIIDVNPSSAGKFVKVSVDSLEITKEQIKRIPITLTVDPHVEHDKIFLSISYTGNHFMSGELQKSSWNDQIELDIKERLIPEPRQDDLIYEKCGPDTTLQNGICVVNQTNEKNSSDKWGQGYNNLKIKSPLKQFKSGIPIEEIKCKEDFVKVIKKSDNMPACINSESKSKLVQRDWIKIQFSFCGADGFDSQGNLDSHNSTHHWNENYCEWNIIKNDPKSTPKPLSLSESELQLYPAKKLLESAYYENIHLGPLKINDVIVGFDIENDVLIIDVLYRYSTSSEMDIVKNKIRNLVGEEIKIEYVLFKNSPRVIEMAMPYHWNEYLYKNKIEFTPTYPSHGNNDNGIGDGDILCSPLTAPNGTNFYIASTIDVEPFLITDTFVVKEKPQFCKKTWKTDVILEEPDRVTSLWLEMGQGQISN